ncbi:MAG TPA: glutamate synthase-related protein [Bacteroidales bacterium]|nr:glutamate synthase-related protein [Bacteroidales bacterium]
MPEKYHIKTAHVSPRLPRIGKYGVVDWREDCARCHNCVKKGCVYDKYREENIFIRDIDEVHALYYECMGCFSCIQNCTKNLLTISINSEYKMMGNDYWIPQIFNTLWLESETGKVPVSGAGYRGKFSGHGFDSMWTDMSEIVRPTRDGIHGREYISTSVDIGKKLSYLSFDGDKLTSALPPLISLPFPVILDMPSEKHALPKLTPFILETARQTGLIAVISSKNWEALKMDNKEEYLNNVAIFLDPAGPEVPDHILSRTRLIEIPDGKDVLQRAQQLKKNFPNCVMAVRVLLDGNATKSVEELSQSGIDTFHLIADMNGNEIGTEQPRFIKDVVREIHGMLIKNEKRDEITLIAGGGIALAEHVAKAIICGADLVSINIPLMIAVECRLCEKCQPGDYCPAKLDRDIDFNYGAGRMINLIGAWYWQMVELMGAMGMREARRLRGDVGRAMFKDELEEEIYGPIFRK